MIINSLLDTDLYKFTMQQTVFHQFPQASEVEYSFKCRTPGINLSQYISQINDEIKHLCALRFSNDELEYLRSLRFMKSDYVDFLSIFHLQEKYINVVDIGGGEIEVKIKGPWLHTILFEVPVLAIINEVYFRNTVDAKDIKALRTSGVKRLDQKIEYIKKNAAADFKFSDFGTRRRFSAVWQQYVVRRLQQEVGQFFTGTSNVLLAKQLGLVPIGTMAHEYLQACQAMEPRLRDSQKYALEKWVQEYRGDLGIALTDVIGIDAFLRDFDLYFCKLFDGVRHDSGDPYEWARKVIAHYESMKINPKTKTLVFSDGLDVPKSVDLHNTFSNKTNVVSGIGTNLTNDLSDSVKAINIVLKMISCRGQSVAKLSDSPGKSMCKDEKFLAYLKDVFDVTDPSPTPTGSKKPKN